MYPAVETRTRAHNGRGRQHRNEEICRTINQKRYAGDRLVSEAVITMRLPDDSSFLSVTFKASPHHSTKRFFPLPIHVPMELSGEENVSVCEAITTIRLLHRTERDLEIEGLRGCSSRMQVHLPEPIRRIGSLIFVGSSTINVIEDSRSKGFVEYSFVGYSASLQMPVVAKITWGLGTFSLSLPPQY